MTPLASRSRRHRQTKQSDTSARRRVPRCVVAAPSVVPVGTTLDRLVEDGGEGGRRRGLSVPRGDRSILWSSGVTRASEQGDVVVEVGVGLDLLLLPMLLASIGYVSHYIVDRLVWGLGLALLDIARTW